MAVCGEVPYWAAGGYYGDNVEDERLITEDWSQLLIEPLFGGLAEV
jgi:hypothetical protein